MARLVKLQIVEADVYSGESEKNVVHAKRALPARGLILDRNGNLLVQNETTYSLRITPRQFEKDKIPLLASLLELADSTVDRRIKESRKWSPYRPTKIFRELPRQIYSRVQENMYRLPGVSFEVEERRKYPSKVKAAHILGYVKEISRSQLEERDDKKYRMGDPIGKTGVEAAYEKVLRGKPGEEFRMVNVHGQDVKPYLNAAADIAPESGNALYLTIDAATQAVAESLLVNKRGAVVAMDPRNGEILAFASSPDYHPGHLSGLVESDIWTSLQRDEAKPLFNRAAMSGQPPGSTFKPYMALVGLQTGAITERTVFNCPGYYQFGRRFKCHGGAHGPMTVRDAIKKSCNVFFYKLMMKLNFASWSEYGQEFGFGVKVANDLLEQSAGIFPDSAYFDRVHPGWTRGYLVSLGIGQGDLVITPTQSAAYISAVANGGTYHTPHLVKRIVSQDGSEIDPGRKASRKISIDAKHFKTVQEGMRRMAMENNSTVKWNDVVVAGKTGTSQNPHGKDHSWFVGFAPFDDPQIVVSVFVENGGYGATIAAPIGGFVMEQYLDKTTTSHPRWLFDRIVGLQSEGVDSSEKTAWQKLTTFGESEEQSHREFYREVTPVVKGDDFVNPQSLSEEEN